MLNQNPVLRPSLAPQYTLTKRTLNLEMDLQGLHAETWLARLESQLSLFKPRMHLITLVHRKFNSIGNLQRSNSIHRNFGNIFALLDQLPLYILKLCSNELWKNRLFHLCSAKLAFGSSMTQATFSEFIGLIKIRLAN